MPKFAANLSTMFNEVPFLDRFLAAAEAGFHGVEFLFPYDHPPAVIQEKLCEYRLENVLFNLPPGDWDAGDRGIACIPGREEEFQSGVETALSYAIHLGTRRLHALAGVIPASANHDALRTRYIANLQYAAKRLADHEITLLIEPINVRDIPGYFLNTQAQAYSMWKAVDAPNLKIQIDCYHMQITEGNLAVKLRQYAPYCGHIQVAGVPERHEPDTGEVNYEYIFRLLDEIGYDGWVGCEYRPANGTSAGLGWLKRI